MSGTDNLYAELKPQMSKLANPLFELSEIFLHKSGNFLPHAAILTTDGQVQLVAAAPDGKANKTNSVEVLPILHEGLRRQATEKSCQAVAVAENVTITLEGQRPTQAIKVLFEHQRGLTVALYLPFFKKFLRGYSFGKLFSMEANPEVNLWPAGDA